MRSDVKRVLLSQSIHEAGMKLLKGRVEIIIAPDTSETTMRKFSRDVHGPFKNPPGTLILFVTDCALDFVFVVVE